LVEPALLVQLPIFCLSKSSPSRTDNRVNQNLLLTVESDIGAVATIYDYDLYLYAFSQIYLHDMPDLTAKFRLADFIDFMNWDNSGSAYRRLYEALLRLKNTTVTILEVVDGNQEVCTFPLVAELDMPVSGTKVSGSSIVSLRIPEIIANSADKPSGVVFLNKEYTKLNGPTDRAIYRLAMNDMTAGRIRQKKTASWTIADLMKKIGSRQRVGPFKANLLRVLDSFQSDAIEITLEGMDQGRNAVLNVEML
jgi:plasmid replication initiation protein